jgi:hypothetical protein
MAEGYTILPNGQSIYCWHCGLTSYNLNDVANHYCGHCGIFHDDFNPTTVVEQDSNNGEL